MQFFHIQEYPLKWFVRVKTPNNYQIIFLKSLSKLSIYTVYKILHYLNKMNSKKKMEALKRTKKRIKKKLLIHNL